MEHEKYSKEVILLKKQIKSYETLTTMYKNNDSIKSKQIESLHSEVKSKDVRLEKLKKSQYISWGAVLSLVTLWLLK